MTSTVILGQKNNVGINIQTPEATLDVNGTLIVRDAQPTENQVDVVGIDSKGKLWKIPIDKLRSKQPQPTPSPLLYKCPGVQSNCQPDDLKDSKIATATEGQKICWGGLQYSVVKIMHEFNGPSQRQERLWLDRDLGAISTSENDIEAAEGWKFQWGRSSDGHQCPNVGKYDQQATSSTPFQGGPWDGKLIEGRFTNNNWLSEEEGDLWKSPNYTNNPCPKGWRVPTLFEFVSARGLILNEKEEYNTAAGNLKYVKDKSSQETTPITYDAQACPLHQKLKLTQYKAPYQKKEYPQIGGYSFL